jgi:serine/threonine-protein kinase
MVTQQRERMAAAERNQTQARGQADGAEKQGVSGAALRTAYERVGQTTAMVEARREALAEHELRAARKDAQARDLRRQIEDLRAQLARYADAMEEDLSQGRERVAQRTREGVTYERSFTEATDIIVRHLRGRPECRDLLDEFLRDAGKGGAGAQQAQAPSPTTTAVGIGAPPA